MKALKVMATIYEEGQLTLDHPLTNEVRNVGSSITNYRTFTDGHHYRHED